jgi:hypothetical protein
LRAAGFAPRHLKRSLSFGEIQHHKFMKVLRHIQFWAAISILIVAFASNAKASTPPIIVKVANAPQFLVAGQSHIFTIEVQNTSDAPFTFSLLPGFNSPMLCWQENRKVGRGAGGCVGGAGSYSSTCTSFTNYNPETGEIICKTLCYKPSDFVTLKPKETRTFEVEVEAPEKIYARRAIATVNFELNSDRDGKDLDLTAWTGKVEFTYELPIVQKRERGK